MTKSKSRKRRHARVRARISGTATRPRLSVYRSLGHMFVQLIDDETGKTLTSVHSKKAEKNDATDRSGNVATAYTIGQMIAKRAQDAGVSSVVFDRGGYAYLGRVKAVAEGARDGGLQF
jgi:large subunit ribosomal protein L18